MILQKGGKAVNEIISEAEFRRESGKTAGKAYLFFGEEDYLKAHAVKTVRESVCPESAFAVFNDIVIDALDYTPDTLLCAMSAPPMMTEGKLILLRGLDFTAMRPEELSGLLETLALLSEYDYNTVIIHVADGLIDEGILPKKPSATLKKLSEVAIPVRFAPVSESRLAAWSAKHFAHLGVSVSGEDAAFLIEYVGKNMFRLAAEIEKIAYFVLAHGRGAATREDIREVATATKETDTFALSNAILSGKYHEALQALDVLRFERTPPTVVMGELSKTLSNMYATRVLLDAGRTTAEVEAQLGLHSYRAKLMCRAVARLDVERLRRVIELCVVADRSVKRSFGSGSDYAVIEKLICSL